MRQLTHFVGGKHTQGSSGRISAVFDPNTGLIQSQVPLVSRTEVEFANSCAAAAQPAWAAQNPQRRARVFIKFVELVSRDLPTLARLLSMEHGKTISDAKGDIQRGWRFLSMEI